MRSKTFIRKIFSVIDTEYLDTLSRCLEYLDIPDRDLMRMKLTEKTRVPYKSLRKEEYFITL